MRETSRSAMTPEKEAIAKSLLHPFDHHVFADELRRELARQFPQDGEVRTTIATAKILHEGQTRETGMPYDEDHAFPVARIFLKFGKMAELSKEDLALGLQSVVLHDTIENMRTASEREQARKTIRQFHGEKVLELVDSGFTKPPKSSFTGDRTTRRRAQNAAQMQALAGFGEKERLILALGKLADRVHNIVTLRYRNPRTQKRYLKDTIQTLRPFFEENLPAALVNELDSAIKQHQDSHFVFATLGITPKRLRELAKKWYEEEA